MTDTALYGSIWIALALFAAGEIGRRLGRARTGAAPWAWRASATGAVVAVIHVLLALHLVHDWSHASAMAAAARQTEAVYGLAWGGGVFVNYAFLAAWIGDLVVWRRSRVSGRASRTDGVARILLRAFYAVIIVNGAVVFAAAERRWMGIVIVAALIIAWAPHRVGRQ